MALDVAAARGAIEREVAEPLGISAERGGLGHPHDRQREHGERRARARRRAGQGPARAAAVRLRRRGPGPRGRRRARPRLADAASRRSARASSSALGFLAAPLAFDFVRTWRWHARRRVDWDRVNGLLPRWRPRATALLAESGRRAGARSSTRGPPTCATSARGTRSASGCQRARCGRPTSCIERSSGEYARLYGRTRPGGAASRRSTGAWYRLAHGRTSSWRAVAVDAASRSPEARRAAYFPALGGLRRDARLRPLRAPPGRSVDGPGDRRGARVDRSSSARGSASRSTTAHLSLEVTLGAR